MLLFGVFLLITPLWVTAQRCENVGDPRDFNFVVANNLGVATWYKPTESADCSIEYLVEYFINDDLTESFSTTKEFHVFDQLPLCSTLEVRITSIDLNDEENTSGEPVRRAADTDITQISNLHISEGVAIWDVQPHSEKCTYDIELDGTTVANVMDDNREYALEDITACSDQKLKVIPKHINGRSGTSGEIPVTLDVEILSITQVDTNLVWETSVDNINECTFHILFDKQGEPIPVKGQNYYDLTSTDLTACVEHEVTVSYGSSSAQEGTVDIPPGELKEFKVDYDEEDKLVATWSEKFAQCEVLITIEGVEKNYGSSPAELDESVFNYCEEYEISARAVVNEDEEEITKSIVSTTFNKRIGQIETFTIEEIEEGFEAKWDEAYEKCKATITFDGVDYEALTGSRFLLEDLEVDFCELHTASLVIAEDEYIGDAIDTTFTKTIGEIASVKVTYLDDTEEVTVEWPAEFQKCNIDVTYKEVSIIGGKLDGTSAAIDTSGFTYCLPTDLVLIASDDEDIMKKTKDFEVIIVGQMEDFEITPNPDGFAASWSEKFAQCIVEIEVNGIPHVSSDKQNPISVDFDAQPCKQNTVRAYAAPVSERQGLPATAYYTKGATLEESGFEFIQNSEYISATWLDEYDTCRYELIVLPEYDVIDSLANGAPIDISYCTLHQLIVRVMSDAIEELDEDMYFELFEPQEKFDIIEEISLQLNGENVIASWEIAEVTADCSLSYVLLCNVNDEPDTTVGVDDTQHTFACTVDSSVTAYTIAITPKYIGDVDVEGTTIVCSYDTVKDDIDDSVTSLKLIEADSSSKCPATTS